MRIRLRAGRNRAERGAAAVEFAMVLPLMLLVLAGIVDFGRAFFTEIQLTNAAREGARASIVSGTTAGAAETRMTSAAVGVPGFQATASPVCPGGTATVTAAADPFQWLLLGGALSLANASSALPTRLSATAVMKCGG